MNMSSNRGSYGFRYPLFVHKQIQVTILVLKLVMLPINALFAYTQVEGLRGHVSK